MSTKKLQVFISSTYSDLKSERQAGVEAILKAGHIPAGMELFAAGSESQMEIIKRWIAESDVYMLILGGRYGSIHTKTGLSYIELEYDYAVSLDKPVFAVVVRAEALERKVKQHGTTVIETEHALELKIFREKVLTRHSSFFDDAKDIKLAVHESLPDLERRKDLAGWVSGAQVKDPAPLLEEIKTLGEENRRLRNDMEIATEKQKKLSAGREAQEDWSELTEVLRNMKVRTTVLNKDGDDTPKSFTLLAVFEAVKDRLLTGVMNRYNMTPLEHFLYFSVCPKLHVFELVENERVPGAAWRRYGVTKKGARFLAHLQKQKILEGGAVGTVGGRAIGRAAGRNQLKSRTPKK